MGEWYVLGGIATIVAVTSVVATFYVGPILCAVWPME
ncbi:hypothetical protein BH23CHL10_BH23CHL10_17860 [soil metagenome]